MNTYEYFQPEYVSKFKCDGQKCSAKCCRRWAIIIDKKTYKKYSDIKPKSAAKEITSHISKIKNSDEYTIKMDENLNCPFLTEDNWCKIQRKYGEDFLSVICSAYPRHNWKIGNFYERSLTLTCPVAAEKILLTDAPLKFEKVTVSEQIHINGGGLKLNELKTSDEFLSEFVSVQETAISILQERTLNIDRRLLMLGLYIDKLGEILRNEQFYELHKVNLIYRDKNFLQEQSAQFSAVIKFNVREYVKIMINIIESLYGKDSGRTQSTNDRKFLDAVINTLKMHFDENDQIKISEVAENYLALGVEREKFLQRFSNMFENYIVNEFFFNLYPFRFVATLTLNYGIFIAVYKMLELLTFSMALENTPTPEDLLSQIMWYENNIYHNVGYVERIADYMKDKDDILKIMQSMLQV